jgi:Cupin superfamily protein
MLESLFGCKVNANVYVTPSGANQAFETHFDWMDSIIVQITGCKVWRVSSVRSALNPLPDTVFKVSNNIDKYSENNSMPQSSKSIDDSFEMSDGALLYLPRGFAHEAATNCSSSTSSSSSDNSCHHAGSAKNEIIDKIPSIHITFGLETATDSTVEIFLHFYISTSSNSIMTNSLRYLDGNYDTIDIMEGQYLVDVCHNSIYSYGPYQLASIDLEHSTCIVKANHDPTHAHYRSKKGLGTGRNHHELNSIVSSFDVSQLVEIFCQCLSDGSILRVRDISLSDLLHLILHVAATATATAATTTATTTATDTATASATASASATPHQYDATKDKKSSASTTRVCNSVNNGTTVNCTSSLDSSVLRQAIATTTFTTRNQYKPNLYDILPKSLEYLHDFLSSTSTSHLLQQAVTLGIDMGIFTVSVSTPQNPSTTTTKERTSPKGEILSNMEKLNYIKRFITSSPSLLFNHSKSVNDIGIESKWSILEIREIIYFREWDISVIMSESLIDVEYYVRKSFQLLSDSEGSGEGSGESEVNLYCASWIRMTDELRQQRVAK